MRCEITDRPNGEPDMTVEAVPMCGVDFCDRCGDCLHCYGYPPCYGDSAGGAKGWPHRWIVYADLMPERAAELLAATTHAGDE